MRLNHLQCSAKYANLIDVIESLIMIVPDLFVFVLISIIYKKKTEINKLA